MASLQSFRGLIFVDAGDHAHYTLYNRTDFVGLSFTDSHLSVKTTRIRPHENFPLYGIRLALIFKFSCSSSVKCTQSYIDQRTTNRDHTS
jgi:hypothetical protein